MPPTAQPLLLTGLSGDTEGVRTVFFDIDSEDWDAFYTFTGLVRACTGAPGQKKQQKTKAHVERGVA